MIAIVIGKLVKVTEMRKDMGAHERFIWSIFLERDHQRDIGNFLTPDSAIMASRFQPLAFSVNLWNTKEIVQFNGTWL